ncbi:MAG: PorV/PorQ family protein [Elusimicrobia bacterium]|nr:PorV/PorQ family protein [Elusimicrobiota bacterium]
MRPSLALLLLLSLPASGLRAEPGGTAAATLRRPLTARPVGMGEAFAAVDGGLDSLGYNPAGAGRLKKPELGTSYLRGAAGDDFGFLGYSHPFPLATLTGAMVYYNAGTIELNLSDGTRGPRTAQQDMVGLLSAALPLGAGLCLGGTAKFYRFELAQEARAAGFAGDLGAVWHTPLSGLNLGAAIQNLGPDVRYESVGDPLPSAARFGAAYDFSLAKLRYFSEGGFSFNRFLVTADAVKPRDQRSVLPSTGLEMGMSLGDASDMALRFGYLFERDIANFTFGAGFRQGRWRLDYGLGVGRDDVESTHHVTLGARF